MTLRSYKVTFLTPAFLGDANQSGEWRTPAFKALLRQWWRVAVAQKHHFKVSDIREAEGRLLGNAWLAANQEDKADRRDNGHMKSLVRIRFDGWTPGDLKQVPNIGQIGLGKNQLPAALYSGYGPIANEKGKGIHLKGNAAIQSSATQALRLAFPADPAMDAALNLIQQFGTLGGRSRNGWGSIWLTPENGTPALEGHVPVKDWHEAMKLDWPHAVGTDSAGKLLLWKTQTYPRWEDAMRKLAQTRAEMRRAVPERLLLAYPSTKMSFSGWNNATRVPHSIRFKVIPVGNGFVGRVVHVPCSPPEELMRKLTTAEQKKLEPTYETAHRYLEQTLERCTLS